MNYEELKQKASKGPFEVGNIQCAVFATSEGESKCVAVTLERSDAQLIEHTLNNFDAVVEALEEMLGLVTLGANGCVVMKARQALKEAKEIKS